MLAPNAEGVVDLTAVESTRNPDDINPFVSRVNPAESVREITLRIQGVLGGRAPGAIINDRPIRLGEAVDVLTLELIETDAAVLRIGGRLIRLPVGPQPARIRLVR